MSEPVADARKSRSFDLVHKEINETVEHAEVCLVRFQEDRDNTADLQNCMDALNQLRGIFVLLEFQGVTVLLQEALALISQISNAQTPAEDERLAGVNQALFVIRRYIEYFARRREDHPQLLLGSINQMRRIHGTRALPESYFLRVEVSAQPASPVSRETPEEVFAHRASRIRHMFQTGLLMLLRDQDADISLRLLSRAAEGAERLCAGATQAETWHLVQQCMQRLHDCEMRITDSRKRLCMQVERLATELLRLGAPAAASPPPEGLLLELLYVIGMSADPAAEGLLKHYGLSSFSFPETLYQQHLDQLMGPGGDVIRSLAKALEEELGSITETLEFMAGGEADDVKAALPPLAEKTARLSQTLVTLARVDLSNEARSISRQIENWIEQGVSKPDSAALNAMADALLAIEQAVRGMAHLGLASSPLTEGSDSAGESGFNAYLSEALIVVIAESSSVLDQARKGLTAFFDSKGDALHIQRLPNMLGEVHGALTMIEEDKAAGLLASIARFVSEHLMQEADLISQHRLETLADGLAALEYYVEGLGRRREGNPDLLRLAEDSVRELGY